MKRRRDEVKPMNEINVTNLLDTVFVLLMAFMVVAPASQHGVDLDLPVVAGETMEHDKTLIVTVAKPSLEGGEVKIVVEDLRYTYEDLAKFLEEKKAKTPELEIIVEVDRDVRAEDLLRTVTAIKNAGINNIGLPTLPSEEVSEDAPE